MREMGRGRLKMADDLEKYLLPIEIIDVEPKKYEYKKM